MKLLLDTNAYTAFHRGDEVVVRHVRQAEKVVLSAVVVGELLFGFRYGTRYHQNLARLEDFLDSPEVSFAPVTLRTCEHFGILAASLRAQGTPIPTNDVWIAAHAIETESELVTFDHHFARLSSLRLLLI